MALMPALAPAPSLLDYEQPPELIEREALTDLSTALLAGPCWTADEPVERRATCRRLLFTSWRLDPRRRLRNRLELR